MNRIIYILILCFSFIYLPVAAEDIKSGGKKVGQGFVEIGKSIGKPAKSSGKAVGKAFKESGKSIGEAFKKLGTGTK